MNTCLFEIDLCIGKMKGNNMNVVPILLLAYNRPQRIQHILEKLKTFGIQEVFISVDGPLANDESNKIKVDATLEGQTDIELFNRIRSKFTIQQCCVVIVSTRTNATISDVLFKWCAEFTRCNPWTYVIFHSLDVAWLATENQNR